jgi:hypothetical protein
MATNVGSIFVDLDLDSKKFEQGLKSSEGKADGFSKGLSNVGKGALVVGAGLLTAATAAIAFGADSVKSFSESQDALAQLDAVLKSTNGAAGVTRDTVIELANSFQRTTKFSDEMIMGAESMLLTFTNIGSEVFPSATEAVLNMSQALGQDLKSSSVQLGKALNNPIDGVTALSRVGVQFTDVQKDMIANMVNSGNTMGAQKLILAELATEFGGSAVAAGQTFSGQMEILKNNFDDLKESIGGAILTAINPFLQKITGFIAQAGGVQGALQAIGQRIMELSVVQGAMEIFRGIWDGIRGAVELLRPSFEMLWDTISTKLLPVFQQFWAENGEAVLQFLKYLGIAIGVVVVGAILALVYAINGLVSAFVWWQNTAKTVRDNITNQILGIRDAFVNTVNAIRSIVSTVYGAIIGPFQAAFEWIKSQVASVVAKLNDLNPFTRHSPSLVDNITRGTGAIVDQYGKMFSSISGMAQGFAPSLSPSMSAVTTGTMGNMTTPSSGPANNFISVGLGGIVARNRADLRAIGEDILEAVNEGLRAKGQQPITGMLK